jgi:4-amino-4-deoxy-L-arabinose transferase-like glycosyltransferase
MNIIKENCSKLTRHKSFWHFATVPLCIALLFVFIVCSWPFISFPLTDGDVSNWIMSAYKIRVNNNFLSEVSDQGHGPLMAWTAAIITKLSPDSFYMYNLFNLCCGLLGVCLVYFISKKLWKNRELAILAVYLFVTNIAFVYFTRTPMYDWPATIFYFAFCCFYYLFVLEKKWKYFCLALMFIGIGSLSRFSISLGLSGIFMILVSLIYKRSIILIIRDGLIITGAIFLFNLPWLWSQAQEYGVNFIKTFINDNTGRYIKSTRPDSYYHKDFYGLPLYVLIGFLPHTFYAVATLFNFVFFFRTYKTGKIYCLCFSIYISVISTTDVFL